LRPSCRHQVPVTLQIRPIDRGRDHKPLIRLGDRGPSSLLALIRERALSRRPVQSLLQVPSVNAPCLCPGRQPLSPQPPLVTGGNVAGRPRLICHTIPRHHRTTTTHPRPLLTFSSTAHRVLCAEAWRGEHDRPTIEHDRLLPLMIGHSCEVACEINPIRRDPQLRRPCHGRSSTKHSFKLQKGQEERKKGSTCRKQKKALLSAFSDLSSVVSCDEIRERYPPEESS